MTPFWQRCVVQKRAIHAITSTPLPLLSATPSCELPPLQVRKTRQGWVPVDTVATFLSYRVGTVTGSDVVAAAETSAYLTLAEDKATLRKRHPMRKISLADTQSRSVVVEHLPAAASPDFLRGLFSAFGDVLLVTLVEGGSARETPTLRQIAQVVRAHPAEPVYALVQFANEAAAARAAYSCASKKAGAAWSGLSVSWVHRDEEVDPKRRGGGGGGGMSARRGSHDDCTPLQSSRSTTRGGAASPHGDMLDEPRAPPPLHDDPSHSGSARRESFGRPSSAGAGKGHRDEAGIAGDRDDKWANLRSGGRESGAGAFSGVNGSPAASPPPSTAAPPRPHTPNGTANGGSGGGGSGGRVPPIRWGAMPAGSSSSSSNGNAGGASPLHE